MKRAQSGFTLLELMVVVVLAGILLGIGVPAMGNFIRNARITGAANDVMAGLHFARSEAIKRRVPVTFCTSADSVNADSSANPNATCAASVFLTGWIVFADDNGDNIFDLTDGNGVRDAGELLLLQREPIPNTITGRAIRNPAGPLRVTYLNNGFGGFNNGVGGFDLDTGQTRLVLCDERGNVNSGGELSAARGIAISVTGRAGVTRDPTEIQTLINAIGQPIGGCS